MAGFIQLLAVYLLGGISFLPLCVLAIYLHATFSVPTVVTTSSEPNSSDASKGKTPELANVDEAKDKVTEKKAAVEQDTAEGYFAVTREFTPAGVNARPPERTASAVGYVPQPEKPTIGQAVYRSIFDQKNNASTESVNSARKNNKRPKNVFYVILRHRCLMLYDDEEQTEVRHVIPLANYLPNIYDGEDDSDVPEGELYIKRNAIRLSYKTAENKSYMEGVDTEPYYLFSEDCCLKEDFYFAMIAASEEAADVSNFKPLPIETRDLISLVQRLHASEEHMQSRWLNALLGRVFLGIYKTKSFESMVRLKIAKKISRVAKPGFLSDIELGRINVGDGLPYITNPRMREMNVDGSFMGEADVSYSGGFSMEISTVATIHLGARIRRREVSLVLSVALKKIEGHLLFKIKPPPSNRVWISFETPPKMDLEIVPIVSSRQITYGLIVRAIESRIREVFAESMVYPNFDDTPFFETMGEACRGGIWEHMSATHEDPPIPVSSPISSRGVEDRDNLMSDSASVLTTSTGDSASDIPSEGGSATTDFKTRSKSMSSSPPDRSSLFGQTPPGGKPLMPSVAVVSADPINITASLDKPDNRNSQDAASAMRAIGTNLSPTDASSSSSLKLPPKAAQRQGGGKSEITRRLTDTSESDRAFLTSDVPAFFKNSSTLSEPPRSPSGASSGSTPRTQTDPITGRPRSLTNTPLESKTQSPAIGALINAGAQVKKWYKTRNQQNGGADDRDSVTATSSNGAGGSHAFSFPKASGTSAQTAFSNLLHGNNTSASLNETSPRPTPRTNISSNSTASAPIQINSKSYPSRRRTNGQTRRQLSPDDFQESLLIVAKPAEVSSEDEKDTSSRSAQRKAKTKPTPDGQFSALGVEINENEAAAWGLGLGE